MTVLASIKSVDWFYSNKQINILIDFFSISSKFTFQRLFVVLIVNVKKYIIELNILNDHLF